MGPQEQRQTGQTNLSRRDFIRSVSFISAGAVAGSLGSGCEGLGLVSESAKARRILNHNPQMGYRRLGKTGLVLSEVSLGGHFKDRDGSRYWAELPKDEVPWDVAKNRIDVVSACIDAGINYLDISTAAECLAYGAALRGRRDRMIIAADDYKLCARNPENCTVAKLTYDMDQCLGRLGMEHIDIWRIKADMYGKSTDAHVGVMIETFEKAKKAGKVRYFGISSHSRPWLQHVIETFPEVQVISFPISARTREKGKPVTRDSIEEVNAGFGADTTQGIFDVVRQRNIGVIAIKPFLGGELFRNRAKFPVTGDGDKQEHDLARLTLQCILANDAVTATVPGLTTVAEVENAVRASYMRQVAPTAAQRQWLEEITEQRWAAIDPEYAWLRDWEVV